MHRTEGDNSISVGGKDLYSEGPPGTTVTDDALNAFQEEIATVIEDAGISLLTASSDTRDQLSAAITALIAADAPGTGPFVIPDNENYKSWRSAATTVEVECDNVILINSGAEGKKFSDVDVQLDITLSGVANGRDIPNATISEKASHWYDIWLVGKADGTIGGLLVATVTGTCDANTPNKLTDSSENFNDEGVKVGDYIFQTTDHTYGYVGAIDSDTVISCVDRGGSDLDLFPDGNETFVIVRNSPTLPSGYTYQGRFGSVYNDAGSDLDEYVKIKETTGNIATVVLSGGAAGAFTAIDLSAVVPPTARKVSGYIYVQDTGAAAGAMEIAGAVIGATYVGVKRNKIKATGIAGDLQLVTPFTLIIENAQTMYYKLTEGTGANVFIAEYEE